MSASKQDGSSGAGAPNKDDDDSRQSGTESTPADKGSSTSAGPAGGSPSNQVFSTPGSKGSPAASRDSDGSEGP